VNRYLSPSLLLIGLIGVPPVQRHRVYPAEG